MPLMTDLQLDRLSLLDRVTLVHELWDSIATSRQLMPLTEAQRAELARRVQDDEDFPDDVVPWDDIRAAAIERLSQ